MRRIMLRRMKNDEIDGVPIVSLPPSEVIVEDVHLILPQREIYDAIKQRVWDIVSMYVPKEHTLKQYRCVLEMLLRLREGTVLALPSI